jgi:hypothetical protein
MDAEIKLGTQPALDDKATMHRTWAEVRRSFNIGQSIPCRQKVPSYGRPCSIKAPACLALGEQWTKRWIHQ